MIREPILGLEVSIYGFGVELFVLWMLAVALVGLLHETLYPPRRR